MKSYSELLIENERLRDELAELRDAAERVCTEAGEYRDSEHDLPTWGATEDSLANLAAVLASTEGGE
jgi:hypothetical protein